MKAWLPWGLRHILSLKLPEYTVNTLCGPPGHSWEDHTQSLTGGEHT